MVRRVLGLLAMVLVATHAAAQTPQPLRPGDVLALTLPGEAAFARPFPVDRDGRIELPEAGLVEVAGLAPAVALERLRTTLTQYFRDTARLRLDIRERRLLVTVEGFVKTPGAVDLPAGASVQSALSAAGGLAPGAQLDRMQVRRGGQIIAFDYKAYLDSGDPQRLPRLQTMDVVFVPASPLIGNVQIELDARALQATGDAGEGGQAIKVFGEVRQPGSFAHRPGMTVVDAIMRAGGVTQFASVEQVRIIGAAGQPQLFNLKDHLDLGAARPAIVLTPGATVFVPRETDGIRAGAQIVYVMGEVFKPGPFETKDPLAFVDVLANAGGPTRYADSRQIRVLRQDGSVEVVDMAELTGSGGRGPIIRPGDAILVPEKADQTEPSWLKVEPGRAVYVMGAMQRPGRYEWSNEMSILDLLAQAGGPTPRSDLGAIRVTPMGGAPVVFDLGAYAREGGGRLALPLVRAGTTVFVPELPDDPRDNKSQWVRQPADRSIYVMGAVHAPGRYAFDPALSFLDILAAADGPTPDADLRQIKITHRDPARGQGPANRVSTTDLSRFFSTGDERLLPRVLPGDVIFLPNRTNAEWLDRSKEQTVRVLGAIARPGRYRFDDTMTLLDLLAEAGGPTPNALADRIVVVNLSCCRDQARSFDLLGFARTGDFASLPVVRAGDTVYIPDQSQSGWNQAMATVRDIVSILSIFALVGKI
ncbi:MAG: sugar ABC transporter substrate-binding protein [Alphaproteobacteria bacterium]|nr:MAG: sugar ABC transporter substrate-binding protein [Alphaproteobacteria bacterium]